MATFPQVGLDYKVELALGGTWVDTATIGRVYQRQDMVITRGQADESSSSIPPPSQCTFQLDNRLGNYSSRNPTGTYYGQLGRNTPVQVSVRMAQDSFTRTVSNSWGTADLGGAWQTQGGSGTVSSDFQVTGTTATHSVSSTNNFRQSTLLGPYSDVDVTCTWSMAVASVTGSQLEPCNIMFRRNATTGQYYIVRVTVQTSGAIQVDLRDFNGNVFGTNTSSGLTYSAGTKYRVRARIEGRTARAKIWLASANEPYAWLVVGTDAAGSTTELCQPGGVGIRSGISTGNTNTLPVVVTYDDVDVRSIRFSGEVPEWPASVDVSGQDRYVDITAADPLRRLNSGAAPLHSALYRGTMAATPAPVAYWPFEDGSNAAQVTNVINPAAPLVPSSDVPKFANFTSFLCSAPIPLLNNAILTGTVPAYTDTGSVQVRFLLHVPSGELNNGDPIIQWNTTGSITAWQLQYLTGGDLQMVGYDQFGTAQVVQAGGFAIDDELIRVDMNFTQSGGNINWQYSTLQVGSGTGSYLTGTATGYTLGIITVMLVNGDAVMNNSSIGHLMINTTVMNIFAQSNQLNAYIGEDAINRLRRLCSEEGLDLGLYVGLYTSTLLPMGAQLPATLLTLLGECADVDGGMLLGSRNCVGLTYVRSSSLQNSSGSPVLTASYANHEMQPPFQPVTDDQRVHNDITVSRTNGGKVELVQTTGTLSTAAPPSGVGTYPTSKTVNTQYDYQLLWVAGWLLAKGTADFERWASLEFARESNEVVANAALSQALLNVVPGDKVQYTGMATRFGLYDTANQTVNQVAETINKFKHRIALTTVPEVIYHALVLDDATARLDSDSSSTNGTMTTGATSVSVATTGAASVLWTTNAAHFPFDVLVGGERMTVTNITGASSPQTFTVTRSVNGVVKTHGIGESVRLFDVRYIQV